MATATTSQFGTVLKYCPQVRLTVTQSSETNTTATLSYKLEYLAYGYAASTNGVGRSYTITINGSTAKTGTYNINGVKSTKTITSGTVSVTKGTSAKSVSFKITFAINLTWGSTHKDSVSASGTISVAAKPSYTVKYNANGGSGAPTSQTKWYGTTLTLSSTKPTRTGYTFQGWGTSASTSTVSYAAGASYTANAAATLYAVWKANTYTVTYNANGGTGGPTTQTKTYGVALTITSTQPTRTNYNFLGWATTSDAVTVTYASGASYTANVAATLYAVWELAHMSPVLNNLNIERCTSTGAANDEGTYVKVSFDWVTEDTASKTITLGYKLTTATTYTSVTATVTGISGSYSRVIGGGNISTEYPYDISVKVADAQTNTTVIYTVPEVYFSIDFRTGGKGVAIGKPSTKDDFSVDMDLRLEPGRSFGFTNSSDVGVNFITGQSDGSPLIVKNADLANGIWLRGNNSSGTPVNMFRVASDGRLEVNWGTSAPKGRIAQTIWSGSWSSGSISVPDLKYFNSILLVSFSGSNTLAPVFHVSNAWRGVGAYPYSSTSGYDSFGFLGLSATVSGTTLTMVKAHSFAIYQNNSLGGNNSTLTVTNIWGYC